MLVSAALISMPVQFADEGQKFTAAEFLINKWPVGNEARDRFSFLGVADHVVSVEQNLSRRSV